MTIYQGVGMRELQKTVQKFGSSSNKAVTILRPKGLRKEICLESKEHHVELASLSVAETSGQT